MGRAIPDSAGLGLNPFLAPPVQVDEWCCGWESASRVTQEQRSEAELISGAASGDVSCYEALYRENVGRVYALCLRMSRDRGEAEELVQDVFVRVWEKLGSFRGESAFATWLHRLAVNVVIEALRAKRPRLRSSAMVTSSWVRGDSRFA